ncbi:MAG: hypothetical protein AMJ66_08605 [Betaproteobacteria bacterium SG8_40]|nr:MAG: hypothetical protein AMJ66_08605 [Betaproteobacteria bacterium SG8_40]
MYFFVLPDSRTGPTIIMSQVASFPNAPKPKRTSGASSFDIILEKCHDLISERVSDALARMFDEADEALTAFGSLSRDPETSKLYEVTRKKIRSQREAIVTQFRMHFLREFQERVNRVKKIGEQFADLDLPSLDPTEDDDPTESRKFDAMASRLRQYCEEELAALDQRVGVLVGDADLQSEDNPFAPETIIAAYKHTCRQTDSNVDVRMVLLKLFDDYVLDEIRGIYKAVSALLIKNSILPKIRFSIERTTKTSSAEQSPGNAGVAAPTGNVQQEVKHIDRRGTNRMDAMTLDIMAMLLDELFSDPKIPTMVKGLVGRLQTPMLKLVIADKTFFSRKSHPARQMLDKLGELAAALPADLNVSDPVYVKLESIVQRVIEGYKDDTRVFEELCQQLDTLIAEVNEHADLKTQSGPRLADQQQKLVLAKSVAQAEIKARLHDSTVPQPIVEFLTKHWARLLVLIHAREGERSEAWRNALKTVDLLVWSGENKETREERRKMIAVLPNLLKSLSDGLAYAGIDDEVRVQFFAYLRKSHTAIFGRTAHAGVDAPGEKPVTQGRTEEPAPDITPGKPATAEESASTPEFPEFEAAKFITQPVETGTNGAPREPDVLSMQDEPDEAGTGEEMRLDYLPSMDEKAAIPELTDAVKAKTASPAEKPLAPVAPSAGAKQAGAPEFTGSTTRAYEVPSAKLRAEMDNVMDATRTMFSDIDRFIMLGQYQNAISVLDARIKREPSDRGSWVTLMAIYRDTDMKDDFYRTYADFQQQFGESPDV